MEDEPVIWYVVRIESSTRTRYARHLVGRLVFDQQGLYLGFYPEEREEKIFSHRVTLCILTTLRVSYTTYMEYARSEQQL
jgi:hypothetical protein